jgi:hypothetical protein
MNAWVQGAKFLALMRNAAPIHETLVEFDRSLRHATAAAVRACNKSGRMLDAALAYARFDLPVFPVTVTKKVPIPPADLDVYGKKIVGTGGHYKATCDPIIIRKWWKQTPRALIGLPMGAASGVWALDIDTAEDHIEGVTGWNELTAQHEAIITREHRSATDGPHLIFSWRPEHAIACSKGELPGGIQVKGKGGYIVVPPSQRKGRSYTVHRDIDPIGAPPWLIDLIKPKRIEQWVGPQQVTADYAEIAEAMRFIPNLRCDWDYWTEWALAIYRSTAGQGFAIFDEWSAKSEWYDPDATRERWGEIAGSPPNRTGVNKIFKAAREHGWVRKTRPAVAAYANARRGVDEARRETERIIRQFLTQSISGGFVVGPYASYIRYVNSSILKRDPPITAWAVRVDTGVGKTLITIAQIAALITRLREFGPIIYAVPTHKLGTRIDEQFARRGVNAQVFRGRMAFDPSDPEPDPDKRRRMCLNLPAVELAMKLHADISKTCCKHKDTECRFFSDCAYQEQLDTSDQRVDVWIVAHEMLFHYQKVFDNPVAIIIDEAMWQSGLQGMTTNDEVVIPLPSIFDEDTASKFDNATLAYYRERLLINLQWQVNNGPLEWFSMQPDVFDLAALEAPDCGKAVTYEWARYNQLMKQLALHPGLSERELPTYERSELIDAIVHTRHLILVWEELQKFLDNADVARSGRLTLVQKQQMRAIQWRGVREINKEFQKPTLLLDATLPELPVLEVYHPSVEIVADIKVKLPPSVQVRQILGAPTSTTKLANVKHLEELRCYLLHRYVELDRPATLLITQKNAADWMRESGLPENIAVEHYNAIAGLDDYKDVRLLIMAGRIQPGPQVVEEIAAVLSAAQPTKIEGQGFVWFGKIERGIELTDGQGIATECDQHPDPFVEALRWQICNGELVQAFGRARAVNRDASKPLDVDLLLDACLPIPVNAVEQWAKPSLLFITAIDGVMVTAPVDMVRAFPALWSNVKAAYRTVQQGIPAIPHFEPVIYQLAGAKMKRRLAYFDRNMIPDPRAWLEARLGPLIDL